MSYVLAVDDHPIGLVSGPMPGPWPWQLMWNAPWGQHEIIFYVVPGCDPAPVALVTVKVLLEESGHSN